MTDTTVKIKSKSGCSKTGITDTLANRLHTAGTGRRFMAIVEFKVDELGEKDAGNDKVFLTVEEIEPVIADDVDVERRMDEHVRTLQKALSYERKLAEGTQELPFDEQDGPAPKVTEVLAQGKGLAEKDSDGNVTGLFSGKAKEPASV